jgi:hypothetical protein
MLVLGMLLCVASARALSANFTVTLDGDTMLFLVNATEPVNITVCLSGEWCMSVTDFQPSHTLLFNGFQHSDDVRWTANLSTVDGNVLSTEEQEMTQKSVQNDTLSTEENTSSNTPEQSEVPSNTLFLGVTVPENGSTQENIARVEAGFWNVFTFSPEWGIVIGLGITLMLIFGAISAYLVIQNQ